MSFTTSRGCLFRWRDTIKRRQCLPSGSVRVVWAQRKERTIPPFLVLICAPLLRQFLLWGISVFLAHVYIISFLFLNRTLIIHPISCYCTVIYFPLQPRAAVKTPIVSQVPFVSMFLFHINNHKKDKKYLSTSQSGDTSSEAVCLLKRLVYCRLFFSCLLC